MKHCNEYFKTEINGVPYLLPYGQAAAVAGTVLRLNDSGSLLWDGLCRGLSENELLALLAKEYQASENELPLLRRDMEQFFSLLAAHGILAAPMPSPELSAAQASSPALSAAAMAPSTAHTFRIGTVTISCTGADALCEQYFKSFYCAPADPDLRINIIRHAPLQKHNGSILLRTSELILCDCGDTYLLLFSGDWFLHEMHLRKDGSVADIYCKLTSPEEHADMLFHAIRFAFLLAAQKKELFVMHSASLLYRGKAWLFSGCSGTGKSTHTSLWQQEFDTPLLNGDLNLLGISDGIPVVYGLPWCGTSGIYTEKSFPLGGIVFLKQAPNNRASVLSGEASVLAILQRLISPGWTEDLARTNLGFAAQLGGMVPTFSLECTKEPEAAHVMRAVIGNLPAAKK